MPTLPASDYTSFIKAQAASLDYRNGKVPVPIQRVTQPFAFQSILNAQLLGSQISTLVTPLNTTIRGTGRVRPHTGKGNVNHPQALSTVSFQGTGAGQGFNKNVQAGGAPLTALKGGVGTYWLPPHVGLVDTKMTGAHATTVKGSTMTNNPNGNINPH
jgi:hypothetical protein